MSAMLALPAPPAFIGGNGPELLGGSGSGGDDPWSAFVVWFWGVLVQASGLYLQALENFRPFFSGSEVNPPCTEGVADGAFTGNVLVGWSFTCEQVQRFDQFVCCCLFATLFGGLRAFCAWEPNSILSEGLRTVLGWSFLTIMVLSSSGYAIPMFCILKGFAGHKGLVLALTLAWIALERFPYQKAARAIWPLLAARTRIVVFTSVRAGARVIRGDFKTKREPHSTIVDAAWCDLAKEPMLKGHVKVCVRMKDGSAYIHSAMQVGENCALCCAHAVKDPSISIQTAYEAGNEIFLVPFGEPIESKTKCRTMPAYVLEGLKDPHNIWTLWRDERDNATVRDLAVFHFRDAGSRYEGAVTKNTFRSTYQPEAKVATYRMGSGGSWHAKWAGTNLAPISGEPGVLASTLGSDPGMSGSPVFTVSPGGGKGRLIGMNLGQDPQEGGLVLNAATIRHHLLKRGFLTSTGKSFRWNDNWETTNFSFRPDATHSDQPGAPIGGLASIAASLGAFDRTAHASKSWRTMNASERRDSGEQYGDERAQEVWDEVDDEEEHQRSRFGLGRADFGADGVSEWIERQHENAAIDGHYRDLQDDNSFLKESENAALRFAARGGVRAMPSGRTPKGRAGHGGDLAAAIAFARSKDMPYDIPESVAGLPVSERPSAFDNSMRGHAHKHACVGCGLEYEHTHVMVPVAFPTTQDCLNRPVLPFYGHTAGKPMREFSNFFEHAAPWVFTLPLDLGVKALPCITCRWSEQAIMACKAAMFGDKRAFSAVLGAQTPGEVKAIGRTVVGFDQTTWNSRVREIASQVVLQKFKMDGSITHVLLETGDAVIVEAAPGDNLWGVDLHLTDARVFDPAEWRGENVLGLSLMWARDTLKFQGRAHKQWQGQCPNKACALHDPVEAEKTLSRPSGPRVAHSPPGLDLKAMEGQSVRNAIAEANRQNNGKYGKVTESILRYRDLDQEEIADRILSGKKGGPRREAHGVSFPRTTPTVKRYTDYSVCAICKGSSEAQDGACDSCKRTLTVVQGSVHQEAASPPGGPAGGGGGRRRRGRGATQDASVETSRAAAAVAVIKGVVDEYPCLKARVNLGKFRPTEHHVISETSDSHGNEMYFTGFRTRHSNEPRTHQEKELDESCLQAWEHLAESAQVDRSAFAMPPDTLDALMDSLFANCEKRVSPQIETSDPGFWKALAEYITHHVLAPKMPDAADVFRCYEIGRGELEALTEPEWAETLRDLGEDAGLKELEEYFIRRVEKATFSMHADKSCGWDRHLYKVTSKGALREIPDAMKEVAQCAVARLMVFARCGAFFRFLKPEHYVELGLCDPSMPVLKQEATPARKLHGKFKRWRSIMVGSACDELVERVLQKGHSTRLQALYNLGADTMSQIGTGSDDRHTCMLKHRVSAASASADTTNVVSTDVSGMDFCMSWPGCTVSLAERVACLEASPGPPNIKRAIWNALVACEFACAQQGLQYGQTIVLPVSPGVNKSGKLATSANNTGPRSVVSIYCGSLSGSPCGDDCVDVFPSGVDGLRCLSEGAARLGYTIRDAEQGTPDNFESCSKRYVGDVESPRYSFQNLEKAIARAVLCREFNAERANGLLYECRHDEALAGVVHTFFLRGVELGLWDDSPLIPLEYGDGDMP